VAFPRHLPRIRKDLIYCVIPPELESELFDRLTTYYADNPDVTVIVDRRTGPDRRRGTRPVGENLRKVRDRRRARATGTFPATEAPE
jgi:hypothetical protein